MKNKVKAFLATMAALLVAFPTSAFAGEFTEDGSTAVPINATIASSYSVSLPASYTLTREVSDEEIEAGSFTDEQKARLRSQYSSFGQIGVKGNFPVTKAVVVEGYDAGVDGDNLHAASALNAYDSDFLTTCQENAVGAPIGSYVGLQKGSTGAVTETSWLAASMYEAADEGADYTQNAIRWTSPYYTETPIQYTVGGKPMIYGELKASTSDYVYTSGKVFAKLPEADTYAGYIGYTFGLVDRS